jgi:hypothetical protein
MSLLERRRPLAIDGLVMPVSIDAVDCRSSRALAHVHQKVLETIEPTLADRDASATVVLKANVSRVQAAFLHGFPSAVGRRSRSSRRIAVLQCAGVPEFGARTTACRVSAPQPSDTNDALGPAVASAQPMRSAVFHVRKTDSGQPTKLFIGDIYAGTHDGLHERRLCQETARRFSGGPSCCFDIPWGARQ